MKTINVSDETYELIKDQLKEETSAKEKGVTIYKTDGSVLIESSETNLKTVVQDNRTDLGEADLRGANLGGANLEGADLRGANLWGANLWGANLWGAELENAKFYGRGGNSVLKENQVEPFLKALGFVVEK